MSLLADLSAASAALADQLAPRIVGVRDGSGRESSGFVWRTGLAVAAAEALDGDDEVEVRLEGGRSVRAAIAGRDPSTDVALLRLDTAAFDDWPAAPLPRPASFALVAGRGEASLLASLTDVIEVGPAWRSLRGGEIDARITLAVRLTGRAEGAAVASPDGSLIGMAVTSPRRRAIVIPATTIGRAVATLAEKGYVPRGWLGVMLHPVVQGAGAIVLSVEADSPAARAGLLVGDVLTTWDGDALPSVGEISRRLLASPVGTGITLGVLRAGNATDIRVVLGERPRG